MAANPAVLLLCARCTQPARARVRPAGSTQAHEPSCQREECMQRIGEDRPLPTVTTFAQRQAETRRRDTMRQRALELLAELRRMWFEEGVPLQMSARDLHAHALRSRQLIHELRETLAPGPRDDDADYGRPQADSVPDPRRTYARQYTGQRGVAVPGELMVYYRAVRGAIEQLPDADQLVPTQLRRPVVTRLPREFLDLHRELHNLEFAVSDKALNALLLSLDYRIAALTQALAADPSATLPREVLLRDATETVDLLREIARGVPAAPVQTIGDEVTLERAREPLRALLAAAEAVRVALFSGVQADALVALQRGERVLAALGRV